MKSPTCFFFLLLMLSAISARAQDGLGLTQPLQVFRVSEPVTSIDVTTDGQKLAVADRHCVSVFNMKNGNLERVFEDFYDRLGRALVSTLISTPYVRFWPDNQSVFGSNQARYLHNGQLRISFSDSGDQGGIIAISQDKNKMALMDKEFETKICIFRRGSSHPITYFGINSQYLPKTNGKPSAMDISPDSTKVIEACNTGDVYLWNINSTPRSNPLLSFKAHNDIINSIQFNPANGNQVLTASWDGTARLWDLTTRKNIMTFRHDVGGIKCAVFSPDGRYVLTGGSDNTARLWRVATGAKALAFHGHTLPVSCVAFTPDGRKVLTGSWDRTVQVWPAP